jgi:hypothetical protein
MRVTTALLATALASATAIAPAEARRHHGDHQSYEYDGRRYDSYDSCIAAKNHAKKRGTIIGAVAGGLGAAVLGADLGGSALAAGGGALVGREIGRSSKHC